MALALHRRNEEIFEPAKLDRRVFRRAAGDILPHDVSQKSGPTCGGAQILRAGGKSSQDLTGCPIAAWRQLKFSALTHGFCYRVSTVASKHPLQPTVAELLRRAGAGITFSAETSLLNTAWHRHHQLVWNKRCPCGHKRHRAGGTYYVLSSTNLATPLNQWTPVLTNVLVANGNLALTLTTRCESHHPRE